MSVFIVAFAKNDSSIVLQWQDFQTSYHRLKMFIINFLLEHEIKFTEIFASRECWFLVKVKCSFNYNNYYIARTHNSSVDYITSVCS